MMEEMMSDETKEMMEVLDEHLVVKDDEGRPVLQVALLATLYFEDAYKREVREAVVSCCEDYFRRCGPHLRWALHPEKRLMEPYGKGKGSYPRAWLLGFGEDESFSLIYHGAEYDRGASSFLAHALGNEKRPFVELGFFRIAFPLLWFADSSESFPRVMLELCRKLKPVSGYGGIGVVESADSTIKSRHAPVVYNWAQRFPGLEADYPTSHSIWLLQGRGGEAGIKGVNWLTVLGERWVVEMGGVDKIEADLGALDRRFVVLRFEGGILIQAGPRPQLGDAGRNVWPELYVKLSKYLKPIRITEHRPFQYGGPGLRFDLDRSEAWLRRFDDR
ncbi:type VI immunity family protein [Sorangium sp. So ce124]|uniref:type VI immunity family protein n=1 Tax=Sorangium sp. So ce124 TaxID=3133280 RepID=UPI003F60A922